MRGDSGDVEPFPVSAEELTSAWLERTLLSRGADAHQEGRLESFRWDSVGTGQVGACVRVRLQWKDDRGQAPASVLIKFASTDPVSRETGRVTRCYAREVGFYRQLAARSRVRTPRCWVAHLGEEEDTCCVVMEDLIEACQGDQLSGCSLSQAQLALAEMAALHASWWKTTELDYEWIARPGPAEREEGAARYESLRGDFVERYGRRLSLPALELIDCLGPTLAQGASAPPAPSTLLHRDFRCDNLLFGSPRGVWVVDWQTVGLGPAGVDLAYFLGTSVRTSLSRQHLQRLMRGYYRELGRHGVALGSAPAELSYDDLWMQLRAAAVGGLVMAVTASMVVQRTDRGDEMFLAMARRSAALAHDLDFHALMRS